MRKLFALFSIMFVCGVAFGCIALPHQTPGISKVQETLSERERRPDASPVMNKPIHITGQQNDGYYELGAKQFVLTRSVSSTDDFKPVEFNKPIHITALDVKYTEMG